jgi:hypothetical protein
MARGRKGSVTEARPERGTESDEVLADADTLNQALKATGRPSRKAQKQTALWFKFVLK